METKVDIIEGSNIGRVTSLCVVCSKKANEVISMVGDTYVDESKILLRSFPLCETHMNQINNVLMGKYELHEKINNDINYAHDEIDTLR